jgi:hypothetical protein
MDDDSWLPPGFGEPEVEADVFSPAPAGDWPDPAGGTGEDMGCQVINYYFPVEVVVTGGGLADRDKELLQAGIWQELHDAVNRRLA